MYISSNKQLTAEQEVNTLGKWLYKNLDGAFKQQKSSSKYDIWSVVLYSVPYEIRKKYNLDEDYSEVNEMVLNISLVAYRDRNNSEIPKIRINIIEENPDELTIGSKIYNLTRYNDYYEIRDNMMDYIRVRLENRYEGYDFIF